jgi:hypothetical protein
MTLHDAAITRFSQWWRRNVRTGYGYALGASMHGGPPEFHGTRAVRSMVFWAGVLPLLAVAAAWAFHGVSIGILLMIYVAQWIRMAVHEYRSGRSVRDARAHAFFTLLGKAPQLVGVVRFWLDRARGTRGAIIEYKPAPASISPQGANAR